MKMSEVPKIQFTTYGPESVDVISAIRLETLRFISSNNNKFAYAEFKFWMSMFY